MATLDPSSLSSPLLSVSETYVAIVGRSLQESNDVDNHRGPNADIMAPLDPSRYQYDVV